MIVNRRHIQEFEDCPGYGKELLSGAILAFDKKNLDNFKKKSKAQNRFEEMKIEINILRDRLEKLMSQKSE